MEPSKKPRRRLNVLARTARTRHIFQRLRGGWAYDEIVKEEHLSAERVQLIVAQVLERCVIDRNEDRAHLQIERLRPALRLAGEAVARGVLKAIGPSSSWSTGSTGIRAPSQSRSPTRTIKLAEDEATRCSRTTQSRRRARRRRAKIFAPSSP
jgi:hypothetical protein